MDEWLAHTGGVSLDLPGEEIPGDPIPGMVPIDRLADHIMVTAAVTDVDNLLADRLGVVEFRFQRGVIGAPPVDITTAWFVGTPELLRKTGVLLRNMCNQAANRAERGR